MAEMLSLPRVRRLRLSPILTGYIARQFVARFLSFFLALCGVIVLVSVVDLLDRLANKPDVGIGTIITMVIFKTPFLSQEIMPFTILFAGMACFWRLTRSNELVVARSAGVSVWQFLLPVVSAALVIGILTVAVLNPVAAILQSRYQTMEAELFATKGNVLAIKRTGLWLRQADPEGQSVIHAQKASPDIMTLHEVIIFRFGENDRFLGRIDAPRAELDQGSWRLYEAWEAVPGQQPHFTERLAVPTDLTPDKIQESFAPPETVSFWSLP
ncbi:MAG: LptF/LptG family permease, partial [Pirellulales bacterium]|nr:LptF/LptG family permease [Pirellulales bacterium]